MWNGNFFVFIFLPFQCDQSRIRITPQNVIHNRQAVLLYLLKGIIQYGGSFKTIFYMDMILFNQMYTQKLNLSLLLGEAHGVD